MNADGFVWLFLNWEGFAPPDPPGGSGYSSGPSTVGSTGTPWR